jgi:hypothetical protein
MICSETVVMALVGLGIGYIAGIIDNHRRQNAK